MPGVLVALALLGLAGLPPAWQALGALDRAGVDSGQLWRLWTGHAVHFGVAHAALNAGALALLLAGRSPGAGAVRLVGALVCLPLLGGAVLWWQPALGQYRGASGAVVWLGVLVWCDAWRSHRAGRGWLVLLALTLVGKLAWDSAQGAAARSAALPDGVSLAWSAHLAGALLGAAWAALEAVWQRLRSER